MFLILNKLFRNWCLNLRFICNVWGARDFGLFICRKQKFWWTRNFFIDNLWHQQIKVLIFSSMSVFLKWVIFFDFVELFHSWEIHFWWAVRCVNAQKILHFFSHLSIAIEKCIKCSVEWLGVGIWKWRIFCFIACPLTQNG